MNPNDTIQLSTLKTFITNSCVSMMNASSLASRVVAEATCKIILTTTNLSTNYRCLFQRGSKNWKKRIVAAGHVQRA